MKLTRGVLVFLGFTSLPNPISFFSALCFSSFLPQPLNPNLDHASTRERGGVGDGDCDDGGGRWASELGWWRT